MGIKVYIGKLETGEYVIYKCEKSIWYCLDTIGVWQKVDKNGDGIIIPIEELEQY